MIQGTWSFKPATIKDEVEALDEVITQVAGYTGISKKLIKGDDRTPKVAEARRLYAYIASDVIKAKQATIAQHVGYADHTTISYLVRTTKRDMAKIERVYTDVNNVRTLVINALR